MAWPQRKCKINFFRLEQGSQHRNGVEVCKAAETGRVRKALSASRGVGEFTGLGAVVKCREEGLGVRRCGNRDLLKGYPKRGLQHYFPHGFGVRD